MRGDLTQAVPAEFLAGATVLFHCAGEVRREQAMHALHVDGSRKLAEAAAGRVRRWVQLSSVGAYGRRQQEGVVANDAVAGETAAPIIIGPDRYEGRWEFRKVRK